MPDDVVHTTRKFTLYNNIVIVVVAVVMVVIVVVVAVVLAVVVVVAVVDQIGLPEPRLRGLDARRCGPYDL